MANPVLKILLIEDDRAIAKVIQLELEHQGHSMELAADGQEGLKKALAGAWDLILLDIMLPYLNGYEVCKQVRGQKDTPILLLTAKDEIQDKVFGLDLGADDYLTKPFAMEELMAPECVRCCAGEARLRNAMQCSTQAEFSRAGA